MDMKGRQGGRGRSVVCLALAAIGFGGCTRADLFQCLQDEQCSGGVCTLRGVCAFEDQDCASGFRYGDHASVLSGTCVPMESGSTGVVPSEEGEGEGEGGSRGDTGRRETGVLPDTVTGGEPDGTESGERPVDDLPPPSEPLFVDSSTCDFQAGQHIGTVWGGEEVVLLEGETGVFRSRVFDAGEPAWWGHLLWEAGGPYREPLPGGGGLSAGALSSPNALLLRMDEVGTLLDASGLAHDLEPGGGQAAALVEGRFAGALALSGDSHWSRELESGDPMTLPGTGGFTWSLWVRSDDDCNVGSGHSANQVYIGTRGSGALMWLGCRGPNSAPCSSSNETGRAGAHFRREGTSPATLCGESPIADGQWHHIAVVNEASSGSNIRLFVDGVVEATVSNNASVSLPQAGDELTIGRYDDDFEAKADFDEIAMWNRALSGGEIGELFERGRRALRVRAYGCEDAPCQQTEAEKGPWLEAAGNTSFEIPAFLARYVRYEVMLERDSEAAESPGFSVFEVSRPAR